MSFNRPPNDINDMSTLKVVYKIDNETYYSMESVHYTAYILLLYIVIRHELFFRFRWTI